jgi:hypothetical protein
VLAGARILSGVSGAAAQATASREISKHITLKNDVRLRLFAVRLGMKRVVSTRTILSVDSDETVVVRRIIRVG